MENKISNIVFMFIIVSFCFSETGMVLKKGESGIGMWGAMTKALGCDSCDMDKSLTFDYMFPLGLQLSYSINNGGSSNSTQIAYYLKTDNNNLSFSFNVREEENYTPETIGVRWFNKSGLILGAYIYSHDSYNYTIGTTTYYCYSGWSDYNENYENYSNQCSQDDYYSHWSYTSSDTDYYNGWNEAVNNKYISVGKYFKMGSFVIGIEYKNELENYTEINDGLITFKIGTLF